MYKKLFLGLIVTTLIFGQRTSTPLDSSAAFEGANGVNRAPVYTEDFETLSLGDINGQSGWFGQFGNWVVDNSNPFAGLQHMTSVSDGFGQTVAITPLFTPSATGVHSIVATLMLDNNAGVTWQFIPQDSVAALVITRLSFNGDGTVSALVDVNGGEFQVFPANIPSGYFEVAINVDETTSMFEIFIDGVSVFTGQGFGSIIDNVALLSLMETGGPTFFMDDLSVNDNEFAVIPTMSEWGLILFSGIFLVLGVVFLRRK